MSLLNILKESQIYPFESSVESKSNYQIYIYEFEIDGIEIIFKIYPTFDLNNKPIQHFYDGAFVTKDGNTKTRVGKDLNFMNSVLKTISECMIDFINQREVVKKISFQGDNVREKAYVRFFKRHPYFSKFDIDDTHEYSGFVDININKGID